MEIVETGFQGFRGHKYDLFGESGFTSRSKEFLPFLQTILKLVEMLKVNVNLYRKQTLCQKPVELICFSIDKTRNLAFNRDALLKLNMPKLPLDLNVGYPDDYIEKLADLELTNLLLAINHVQRESPLLKELRHLQDPSDPVIITWRGIMTKIITTPYADENYRLLLCKYKSNIYIKVDTPKQSRNYANQHLFEYYGHKAETVMTCNFDGSSDGITDTNVEFCSVVASKLGDHHLVLGAEVDCVDKATEPLSDNYVEIKTHKVFRSEYDYKNFVKFKLLKTWAQSFLAGVQKVLFAFRDPKGVLKETKLYDLKEFPRMARKELLWDANVCLTFGDKLLNLIVEKTTVDDAKVVYALEYDAKLKIVSISGPDSSTSGFLQDLKN